MTRVLPEFSTLVDALKARLSDERTITFIEGLEQEYSISFAQLYLHASQQLYGLQQNGVKRGDEVIIFLRNNQAFVEIFWACLLGGIVPVPISVGISDEHRAKFYRVLNQLQNGYVYTDSDNLSRLTKHALSNETPVSVEMLKAKTILVEDMHGIEHKGAEAEIDQHDIAFIQFSSGSTSEPKGVVLTHRNLLATIIGIGERALYTEEDIGLSWMPLTHDMGLIGFHLNMIVYNMRHYLIPTELFSRRPQIWLTKVAQHQVSILNSPNFGYKHFLKTFNANKFSGMNLSSVRLILNGAEPISVDLCEQFLDAMAEFGLPRTSMYTVYGLAEASLGVSLPIPGKLFEYLSVDRHHLKLGETVRMLPRTHKDAVSFAVVGPPVLYCELKIADVQGNALEEHVVGDILIKGPNVTRGYYRNEQASRSTISEDGWLNTGDLGFLHQGQLVITGRSKEILFVNGQNYYPHDIESVIMRYNQIELGKVVACGLTQELADDNALLIFVLYRGALEEFTTLATGIAKSVNEHMGLEVDYVLPVNRIPKTTSGKIQRHHLLQQYLQGEYDDVITYLKTHAEQIPDQLKLEHELDETKNSISMQLVKFANEVLVERSIGEDDNLFEIGISSMVLSEIHQKIEDAYPGVVDITDMFEHQTLRELGELISAKSNPA